MCSGTGTKKHVPRACMHVHLCFEADLGLAGTSLIMAGGICSLLFNRLRRVTAQPWSHCLLCSFMCSNACPGLQVFPHVAADNRLYAYTLNGYWMDVGQPKDYLKGKKKGEVKQAGGDVI